MVLVDAQLGENIGAAARAMLNCGLDDLRLVRPRDGWPNRAAAANAAGADRVIAGVRLFATTAEAVGDLRHLYATTARPRDMTCRVISPAEAAAEMRRHLAAGEACGFLFGPERSGLVNDDIVLADAVINVPLNPEFASLNLAQAVLLAGYEWLRAAPEAAPAIRERPSATKAELHGLFDHLESALDESGFLGLPEKRPSIVRNLRNIFQRANLTDREVRTLRGVITALHQWRRR